MVVSSRSFGLRMTRVRAKLYEVKLGDRRGALSGGHF